MLSRRLRDEIEREGRVIVARALTLEKAKITVPLLIAALFYDLSTEKTVSISSQSERRERDLQELFRKARKPVALFVDDAHDLHPKTLTALKRLVELVVEGGGQLSVVLIGHPKLKNDLRRPKMEEIGDRMCRLSIEQRDDVRPLPGRGVARTAYDRARRRRRRRAVCAEPRPGRPWAACRGRSGDRRRP